MSIVNLQRTNVTLTPDRSRVLIRPFNPTSVERAKKISGRVMALSDHEVHMLLTDVLAEFDERHLKIRECLKRRSQQIREYLQTNGSLSEERELLLGAYFTQEYSLEAAALFNPSMVPHPDQSDLPHGAMRFVLSLRATGEGHISSITFRTGILDAESNIMINRPTRHCLEPFQAPNAQYEKGLFERKLSELGLTGDFTREVLKLLKDTFTLEELRAAASEVRQRMPGNEQHEAVSTARKALALAMSNYELHFSPDTRLSERVLFPATPSQSNGIEDARFVQFHNDDGTKTYYATYTAFDGRLILPQFVATTDFVNFHFTTLNGKAVQNKGMALFPRKINGHYAMLGRQDYENLFVMFSDNLHFWNSTELLLKPEFPWEFVQIGNCGSPIETDAGWLVLSHGVGPMRKYCIGAFLLDHNDPTRVIGRTREPVIKPNESEREGYVPNVVYSCGGLVHNGNLVIPYAMSDYASTFAVVPLKEVLGAMT